MITAVDTNVLIDVFTADPVFAERSAAAFGKEYPAGSNCGVWSGLGGNLRPFSGRPEFCAGYAGFRRGTFPDD